MRLYYTGNNKANNPQPNALSSLGGYPSTSLVPAQGIDQVFGAISQNDLNNGSKVVRALVLKNETEATISGGVIYYNNTSQNIISSYRIALVTLTLDDCGEYYMESIDQGGTPINAIFIDANQADNQLSMPDIASDQYLGIWLERSVNVNASSQTLDCQTLLDQFNQSVSEVGQTIIQIDSVPQLGDYVTIDTILNQYIFWFNDGNQSAPQLSSSYQLIPISLSGSESVNDIAANINSKIQSLIVPKNEASSVLSDDNITINNVNIGRIKTSVTLGDFTSITINQGSDAVDDVESVELIISY